jgi:hypothetical protein
VEFSLSVGAVDEISGAAQVRRQGRAGAKNSESEARCLLIDASRGADREEEKKT